MINPQQIPAEIVRDLLAITRVLYAARKTEGAPDAELDKLEAAGKALVTALSMAHLNADTIGGRAAWHWAEQALTLLGEALCREDASARVFVAAWGQRLRKK